MKSKIYNNHWLTIRHEIHNFVRISGGIINTNNTLSKESKLIKLQEVLETLDPEQEILFAVAVLGPINRWFGREIVVRRLARFSEVVLPKLQRGTVATPPDNRSGIDETRGHSLEGVACVCQRSSIRLHRQSKSS